MNFLSADDLSLPMKGRVAFRPHALRVQPMEKERDPALAWITGTVESGEFVGEYTRYRVRAGRQTLAIDEPHHPGVARLAAGAQVSVGFDLSQARVFPA
jgi:iron(III) transport system ATP-binding protein